MTEGRTRVRMKLLAAVVVVMFGALGTRLWFLQVLAAPSFRQAANQNQLRVVPLAPVRGEILDRSGQVLVGNRPSLAITVNRLALSPGQERPMLARLSRLLRIPVRDLRAALASKRYLPYQPVPVAEDVSKQTVFYIGEHQDQFPGVGYQLIPVRSYPRGRLAAQVLGSVGEGLPGEMVGSSGVEARYNRYLAGRPGKRFLQVNAQGQVLDADFRSIAATPGDDLVLSIDERIQQLAQQSLVDGIMTARASVDPASGNRYPATGGAVVVLDPTNGQVLALASYPSYDPSVLLNISEARFRKLFTSKASGYPLLDRAISGQYPPGSTFKPFITAAALHSGVTGEGTLWNCPAQWQVPGDTSHTVFHNWETVNLGPISIPEALTISCDTVFYQIGYQFWVKYVRSGYNVVTGTGGTQYLQRDLEREGFGRPTGIDVPGEQPGLIPTAAYKRRLFLSDPAVYGPYWQWQPGDDVNMSIGQGYVQVTPLQLATAYAAIANGGTLWRPHVAWKVETPAGRVVKVIRPHAYGHLPIDAQQAAFIRNALTGVTASPSGTAYAAFQGFPLSRIPVAGKTGTADINPYNPRLEPDSWFAAIAPANHPRYVVVCLVEQAGHGGTTAAPIVRRILDGLFGLGTGSLRLGHDQST